MAKQSEVAKALAKSLYIKLKDKKLNEDTIHYFVVEWMIDNNIVFKLGSHLKVIK